MFRIAWRGPVLTNLIGCLMELLVTLVIINASLVIPDMYRVMANIPDSFKYICPHFGAIFFLFCLADRTEIYGIWTRIGADNPNEHVESSVN